MAQRAIAKVHGRRVWDSRGRPTVEVEVALAGGIVGRAIAPAGASTGSGEAVDLRDGGAAFGGLDVRRAVANVNEIIAPALAGRDAGAQAEIDGHLIALDGTPAKARLGGNAIVATSLAVLQAAAASHAEPLWRYLAEGGEVAIPVPEIQIFGGGAHAARRVDVQDFMVVAPNASSFAEALDRTAEVYRAAGQILAERGLVQGVADEGGWWPTFSSNEEALDMLVRAIERARLYARQRGRDLARRRRFRARTRRALPSRTGAARARRRRHDRDARALDRTLPDRLDRRSLGRGRPGRVLPLHGGVRRASSRSSATISSSRTPIACARRRGPGPATRC